jgi:predicted Zn-dependent peptidase
MPGVPASTSSRGRASRAVRGGAKGPRRREPGYRWSLRHYERVLAIGLRVLVVPTRAAHRSVVTMLFRVGSRYENTADNGISHFLEHMLYRGSPSFRTAHEQALAFEELGASLYAATQADYGSMSLSLPPESLARATAIFAEVVCEPRFSAIEIERGIVREEILKTSTTRGARSTPTTWQESSCGAHPLASPSPVV